MTLKHLKFFALILFIFFVFVSTAFGWTKELYSQLIKDAILLSPAEIQLYFSAGKDAVGTSLDRLVQGKYETDSQDAFIAAIVALRDPKRNPQMIVEKLLDMAWYVSDTTKPLLDKYRLALVVQRTECLCVLFDGYQVFTKFNEVLTNAKNWLAPSVGMVEEFYMFGEREFEAEAARSIEVIYNATVNTVVDAWYSAFVVAQIPIQPVQVEGAQIFPKGVRPPLQPIELQFRMNGFKRAVYGEQEVTMGQKELLIEQIVKREKTSRQKVEKKSEPSAKSEKKSKKTATPELEETVSLDDLIGMQSAKGAEAELEVEPQTPPIGESAKQPANPPSEVAKTATQTAPVETKPEKLQPSKKIEQTSKQAEDKKQPEQSKPQETEIVAEVKVSGKDVSDIAEKAKKAQDEVGKIGSGETGEVNLDALLLTLEKSGAQPSEGRELKPKSGEPAPKTEEIDVKLESLDAKQSAKLAEKSQIKVESPVMVPSPNGSPQGELEFEQISRILSDNISGVKFCYELGLKRNPSLSGKVEVEFTIGENGKVESAETISSTLKDKRVEDCILRKIRSLKFPAPEGGKVTVKFPFVFEQSTYF